MKSVAGFWIAAGVVVSACATGSIEPVVDAGKTEAATGVDASKDTSTTTDTGPQDTGPAIDVSNCVTSPPSNVCGVFPQCGCSSNQTCEVNQTALDGTSSCIMAGTKTTGQACTATAGQCASGLTCIWGECHPYCGTSGAMCTDPLTNYCVNLTDSSNNPIPNLLICHINCQLQDPSACGGGGEGCIYFATDTVDCYPVGTSGTCSATNTECKPGDVCVQQGAVYTCAPWCRIGMNDCTSGTCNAFSMPPTVDGQQYGYCM
jgi:hypothetical protein